MKACKNCQTTVKGDWSICPLCNEPLFGENIENNETSLKNVSLRFSRKNLVRTFILISLVIIILYFIIQGIWDFEFFGLEYVLFGLMITWLSSLILIRKRRNIVKGMVYLMIFFSLLSLYFDYGYGVGSGWSITFVIPIISISVLIAIIIFVNLVDLKIGDYILYLELVAILGIIPLLFLIMDWVGHPSPSLISVILSVIVFTVTFIKHRTKIKNELEKRFYV